VTAVDWSRYRKCPVCIAVLGEPCVSLSGTLSDGSTIRLSPRRPHSGRTERTGGA
jgi:hypothetical protein